MPALLFVGVELNFTQGLSLRGILMFAGLAHGTMVDYDRCSVAEPHISEFKRM